MPPTSLGYTATPANANLDTLPQLPAVLGALPAATVAQLAAFNVVPVVASAAARDAIFTAPLLGKSRCFRLDTGYEELYATSLADNLPHWLPVAKTRSAGPELSMKALGAVADGATDCAPVATTAVTGAIALAAAERAAGRDSIIDFDPGVYLFNSSADFTGCTMRFAPGAVIRRAAAATITLGRIIAGDYKILDNSAGGAGQYLLASGANQNDSFNARWAGVKADGTDDSPGMNLTADLCWGKAGSGTRYGFNNAQKNRPVFLPPGFISLQSASWNISGTAGALIRGAGRLVTTISIDTANMIGIVADSVAYPHIEDLIITTTQVQDVTHPFIDADYTGAYPTNLGYLKPQQWTFNYCYMNGNLKGSIGLHFVRIGGSNGQGDTVHIPNCLFGQFTQAPIRLGTPVNVAGNVVDWHIHGGDFQGNQKYGAVESYGGTVYLHGPGMQNQAVAWAGGAVNIPYYDGTNTQLGGRAGATHVGNYAQIDNYGCDVFMSQYSSRGAIENLRSEGACLTRGGGIARVANCETYAGMIQQWNANTAFVQGELVKNLNPTAELDGRAWACWTATPTSGLLKSGAGPNGPAWASTRNGFMQENVTVTAASAVVPCECPVQCVDKGNLPGIGGNEWGAIVIDPTGVNQKFYAKILSHAQQGSVTLDAVVPWSGNAIIRMGELLTDNQLQWIPYDFLALEGEFEHIDGGQYECGQLKMTLAPAQRVTARFSRRDCYYDMLDFLQPFNSGALSSFPSELAEHVGPGTSQVGFPPVARAFFDVHFLLRTYVLKGAKKLLGPILFPRAFGTSPTGDVGVGGLDGAYTLAGTRTDLTRNATGILGGVIAPDPVGFPDNVTTPPANTAGHDLVINGGTSTGTAKSGRVVFATNPGGGAGSNVNDNVESAVIDGDATAGNTRFLLYDVNKGAISRVSVGANDSGGAGFKLLRVPN